MSHPLLNLEPALFSRLSLKPSNGNHLCDFLHCNDCKHRRESCMLLPDVGINEVESMIPTMHRRIHETYDVHTFLENHPELLI